jgi:hypothetical protein
LVPIFATLGWPTVNVNVNTHAMSIKLMSPPIRTRSGANGRPNSGVLGTANSRAIMGPAKNAPLPARTESAKALAMRMGSLARETAVFKQYPVEAPLHNLTGV